MEEKLYYSIKDVSEFVAEEPSTLRYWETVFEDLTPKRGASGRRLYTSKDIDTLRKIKFLLRDKGMHIAAAREQLRVNFRNVSTKTQALEELEKLREELELLLQSLSVRKS